MLQQQPEVDQHERKRRRHEEGGEGHLQADERQRRLPVEQKVDMGDAAQRDGEVGHRAEEGDPAGAGAAACGVGAGEEVAGVGAVLALRRLGRCDRRDAAAAWR